MDTIFMNSENSKPSDTHRLLFKLSGKIDFVCCIIKCDYLLYMKKFLKSHAKTINVKILGEHGM